MNFNDRFGAAYPGGRPPMPFPPLVPPGPSMVPGVTLGTNPYPPPAQIVPPVGRGVQPVEPPGGTIVIPPPPGAGGPTDVNAPPFRIDRPGAAVGVPPPALPTDTSPAAMPTAAPPVRPPARFPVQGADAVPYSKPAIEQQGTTLTSGGPQAPGWAGSVGLPTSAEESKGFDKGQKWGEIASAAGDAIKAIQNKPSDAASAAAATINPTSIQPNQSNQLAAELMNTMLMSKQRQRGLTLTGR